MFLLRTPVAAFQAKIHFIPEADRIYRGIIGVLDEVAIWVTGRTQRGSLVFYLCVILIVAIVTPLSAVVLMDAPLPESLVWFDTPAQAIAGLIVVAGALGAIRANKRFMAVLMVSVTGYGLAFIFAIQGAPDLALTQMLVETISLVAIVLALRSLPARLWLRTPGRFKLLRAVIGAAFGLTIDGASRDGHGLTHGRSGITCPAGAGVRGRRRQEHRERDLVDMPRVGHVRRDLRAGSGSHGRRPR